MKIAVVTDSTAYLNKEQVEKYNIRVVPIPFIIDDKVYNEGIDITTEEFYEKLRTCEKFPTTSQPPVGELVELYESLADEGYDTVISIHLAGTISGFVRTLDKTEQIWTISSNVSIMCAIRLTKSLSLMICKISFEEGVFQMPLHLSEAF